ncbi:MAG: anti-sigma factor antagonist [Candidatus Omnitrophica bacterium]|nr:anti-sigma factor antagonist [Candidatus Omnitrophota bacterium]
MNVETKERNGVCILYVKGEMDLNSSPEIKKIFDKVFLTKENKILINFKDMQYIDSSGLATIVDFFKSIKENKGQLVLCELSEKIKKLFVITRLDKLFKILDTEEQAIGSF